MFRFEKSPWKCLCSFICVFRDTEIHFRTLHNGRRALREHPKLLTSSTSAWSEAGKTRVIPHNVARSFTEIIISSIGHSAHSVVPLHNLIKPSSCKQSLFLLESTYSDMTQFWSKSLIRKLTEQTEHSKVTCLSWSGHQGHQQISVDYYWCFWLLFSSAYLLVFARHYMLSSWVHIRPICFMRNHIMGTMDSEVDSAKVCWLFSDCHFHVL